MSNTTYVVMVEDSRFDNEEDAEDRADEIGGLVIEEDEAEGFPCLCCSIIH